MNFLAPEGRGAGRWGVGVFADPTVRADEISAQYDVHILGAGADLGEEFYAISIERRMTHPAVVAISTAARRELFR